APARALTVVRLASADPQEVGVALRDGDVADRHQADVLELCLKRGPAIGRLPHAAVRGTDVEDRWVRLVDRKVGDASGHRCRADRPEMQRIERAAGRLRGATLLGAADIGTGCKHGDQRENAYVLHRKTPMAESRGADYRGNALSAR